MKVCLADLKISNRTRRSLISTLTALALLLGASLAPTANAAEPRKILTTWLPYYSLKNYLPAALNSKAIMNEIMPFWYTLIYSSTSKKATIKDLYTPGNPSVPVSQTLATLRSAGFKLIPTINDGTAKLVLAKAMADPIGRKNIIASINSLIDANGYDGIDLDFEGFAFDDGRSSWVTTEPAWVSFIVELSASLRAKNKILSVTTPYQYTGKVNDPGYYVYAWSKIAPHIDRLRIMTYDYSTSRPGPIGPIVWVEKTVQYAISVMPASKVWVGLPGYGKDWVTKVEGVCPSNLTSVVKVGAKAATFHTKEAAANALAYGVIPTYDDQFQESTFTYQKSYPGTTSSGLATTCTATRTVWYQNAQSYSVRAKLVEKYKLGGVATWILGMEEPLALQAIATVASSIAPAKVLSTLSVDKNAMAYGSSVLVSGVFALEDKLPVAGILVRIEGKSATDSNWRVLANGVTNNLGAFATSLLLSKSTTIRLVSDGTWERMESTSSEAEVSVSRAVEITAPTSVKSGTSISIRATVNPRTAGASVVLKKMVDGKWRAVGSALTTDSQGVVTFKVDKESRGVSTFAVEVAQDSTYSLVTTSQFSIIVR